MKVYLYIVLGLVVVVVGGAVAVPKFIDWDKYKPEIQKQLAETTGYDVTFGGAIDLALLPYPHLILEKLAIKVPGESADLLTLAKADVNVALAPLFQGEISVSNISLTDPVITLNVNADGRQTWMTEKISAMTGKSPDTVAPAAAAPQRKIALNGLNIENGVITYADARTKKTTTVKNINLVISADTLAGPFKAKGDVLWNAQKVELDVQSGRIDDAAKTIAVQASAKLPDSNAAATFAGVVGTSGGVDIQGETQIQSANLSSTITGVSGKASTLPPLPFNVQGLLTARGEQADLKNMKLTFGDLSAAGALSVQNLTGKSGTTAITANLDSASAVKVENFLPVKSVKTVKAAGEKDVPKVGGVKGLLPETLALPMPMDISAKLKIAGLSYKATDFGGVTVALDKKGAEIGLSSTVDQMPGGGKLVSKAGLIYTAASQGTKGGAIYSDPTLTFDMNGEARAPGKFLGAFLPEATIKSMQPLFKDSIALAAKGAVRPKSASIDSGTMTLGKTSFTLGASSYTIDPSGRDDVVLSLSGQDINLDHFTGAKPQPTPQDKVQSTTATPAPAKKPAGQALQESLQKLDLPVDLTVRADFKNVTMQGTAYGAMVVDGSLKNQSLDLKSASLQDAEGDVMQAAGTVGNIKALSNVNLTLGGKTRDAIAFLTSFKVDTSKLPKDFGPLDMNIGLTGDKPENLAFTAKIKAMDGDATANGILLNALSDKPAVDKISFRVSHPNFEKLMQKFNPAYKAGVGIKKDMDVFANINLENGAYTFSGLNANIGGMTTTGDLKIDTTGAKPNVVAALNAGTIPLDILSGKDRTAKTSATAPKSTPSASTGDVRWSRNAINTAWMHNFNLDLKVNAQSVEYGNWILNDTALAVALKDGAMSLTRMDAKVYGGTMALTADVKSTGKDREPITFDMKSSFKDVALEPLASSFSGARVIKARGNVSLDLETSSSGISPAALISALRGSGKIEGKNVVLVGFDLAAMSRSLVSTTKVFDNVAGLAGAAFKGGETSFDTIDGPFTIAEGIISFDQFVMTGTTATITNKGQVSLPRWTVDMNSSIDLAQPADAPNLDVRFQGPLDNPGNTFAGKALESYIGSRVNDKLQKVITDKLGDKNPELNNLLNNVLGGGVKPAAPAAPAPVQQPAPVVETPAAPAAMPEAAPAPAPVPEQQVSPEQELMNNVLQELIGQ